MSKRKKIHYFTTKDFLELALKIDAECEVFTEYHARLSMNERVVNCWTTGKFMTASRNFITYENVQIYLQTGKIKLARNTLRY